MNKRITCIYWIKNLTTGRAYIGQAVDFSKRREAHLNELNQSIHHNKRLQKDFNETGASNFKFEVLIEAKIRELNELEELWIALEDNNQHTPESYNIVKTMGNR